MKGIFAQLGFTLSILAMFLAFCAINAFQSFPSVDFTVSGVTNPQSYLAFPATFIFAFLLLYFTWNGKIHRAFTIFLPLYILVWIAIALCHRFHLITSDSNIAFILFLLTKMITPLPVVLAWGYTNQIFSFKKAAVIYPFLLLLYIGLPFLIELTSSGDNGSIETVLKTIVAIATLPFTLFIYIFLQNQSTAEIYSWIVAFAGSAMLLSYFAAKKYMNLPQEERPKATLTNWFAFAALIVGIWFIKPFVDANFKDFLRTSNPRPAQYVSAMGETVYSIGIANVVAAFVAVLVGLVLTTRRLLPIGAVTILLLGLTAIFSLLRMDWGYFSSPFGATQTAFILFVALSHFLKNYIVELCYFAFDLKHRFSLRIIAIYFIMPLTAIVTQFVIYSDITFGMFGDIKAGSIADNKVSLIIYITIGTLIGLIGMYGTSRYFKRGEISNV